MRKIKDFIKLDVDVDIGNDVTDDLWPAFVGPLELTEQGAAEFADVLEYDIDYEDGDPDAAVLLDAPGDEWKKQYVRARKFFCAAAGYCADAEYKKWFKEV